MARQLACLLCLLLLGLGACKGPGAPPAGPTADELAALGLAALLVGDGATAETQFNAAAAKNATHRQANFGLGLVDLFDVANDVLVTLAATNDAPFRNVTSLGLGPVPVPAVGGEPLAPAFRGGSVLDTDFGDVQVDSMTGQELRQLLLSALGGLDSAITRMDTALDGADDTFTFTLPRDWNNAQSGTITLSRADMRALLAGLELAAAQLHLIAAFDMTALGLANNAGELSWTGFGPTADPVDANTDGFIDVGEQAVAGGFPTGLGVRASDGQLHLTRFADYMHGAANDLIDAGDRYASSTELDNHWGFELDAGEIADFKSDWTASSRDGLLIFAETFGSGGTTLTQARLAQLDADLGNQVPPGFSLRVSLRGFFTGLPADLRAVPVRFVDDFGQLSLPLDVDEAFTDNTLLGMFPDGLSQEDYELLFL